jgi:hypothetical protein
LHDIFAETFSRGFGIYRQAAMSGSTQRHQILQSVATKNTVAIYTRSAMRGSKLVELTDANIDRLNARPRAAGSAHSVRRQVEAASSPGSAPHTKGKLFGVGKHFSRADAGGALNVDDNRFSGCRHLAQKA